MYEVKSCGVTICFERGLYDASIAYDACNGPEVSMYKFDGQGRKYLVKRKESRMRAVHSLSKNNAVNTANLAALAA